MSFQRGTTVRHKRTGLVGIVSHEATEQGPYWVRFSGQGITSEFSTHINSDDLEKL